MALRRGRLRVLQQVEQVELEDGRALGEEPRRSTARRWRSRRATRRSRRPSCPTSSPVRRRRSGCSRRSWTRQRPRGRARHRRRSPSTGRPATSTGRRTRDPSPRSKVTTAVAACVGSGLARRDLRLEERAGRAFGQEPPDLRVRVRAGILLLRVRLPVAVRIRRRVGHAEQRLPAVVHRVVVSVEEVGEIEDEHVVHAVRVRRDQRCRARQHGQPAIVGAEIAAAGHEPEARRRAEIEVVEPRAGGEHVAAARRHGRREIRRPQRGGQRRRFRARVDDAARHRRRRAPNDLRARTRRWPGLRRPGLRRQCVTPLVRSNT